MEAQIVLKTIAGEVTLELISNREPEAEPLLTLRPKGGIQVRVKRPDFFPPRTSFHKEPKFDFSGS